MTFTMSGLLGLMLLIGVLFSFAPVVLGIFVALLLAGLGAAWLVARRAKMLADEPTEGAARSSAPARSELPKRPPSEEAMRAESTPGKSS
jgi:hypothetical protein